MSHLHIYVVLTHITAKMHFFGLADALVTFLAHIINSFGQPSLEEMCKTWTHRFLTNINVTVNGKKSPTWAAGQP